MKKGRWLVVLGLGILMISSLAIAGELHIGIATEPWDLDPAIRTDTGSGYIITNVYDPLIGLDQNNEPTAEFTLCTGWELKNNAQTIVLFLREEGRSDRSVGHRWGVFMKRAACLIDCGRGSLAEGLARYNRCTRLNREGGLR